MKMKKHKKYLYIVLNKMVKRSMLGGIMNIAKRRSGSANKNTNNSNGGYSGTVGNISGGVMGVVRCDADDDSWYCKLSKYYSAMMMVVSTIGILLVLFYIYVTFIRK